MKKKILHHTSIMIIFAVLVTFLAASVVTYNKLNTYMQRGVREEAQYICLAMDEYGDSFLTKKLRTVSSSRVTLIRKDGTVLYDSEASPKKRQITVIVRNLYRQKKMEKAKVSVIQKPLQKRPFIMRRSWMTETCSV